MANDYHRKSIRLPGYDYSQAGAYFVTIVTHQRSHLFGEVCQGQVCLSLAGECVTSVLCSLPKHFPVWVDAFVVMPDHLHAILVIDPMDGSGEACGRITSHEKVNRVPDAAPEPKGTVSQSLGAIVQNFKSISSRRINTWRNTPGGPVWQRNYYEHIIRTEAEHERIRLYIQKNPLQWTVDCLK